LKKILIRIFEISRQYEFFEEAIVPEKSKGQYEFPEMTMVFEKTADDMLRRRPAIPEEGNGGPQYIVEVYDQWDDSPSIFYLDSRKRIIELDAAHRGVKTPCEELSSGKRIMEPDLNQ